MRRGKGTQVVKNKTKPAIHSASPMGAGFDTWVSFPSLRSAGDDKF